MFYLVKVLIGRAVVSLDRPFDYYSEEDDIQEGMRVLVPFGHSESTVGFVLEPPIPIEMDVDSYNKEHGIRLAKILRRIDEEPLLNPSLIALAKRMSAYYACDLIKILNAFLPPALKPKDSALKKSHGRFIDYVLPVEKTECPSLGKNEKVLLERIQTKKDGVRLSSICAKASLKKLLEKGCLRIEKVPVSRIPEMVATSLRDFSLTTSQREAYDAILGEKEKVSLLKGVTGSGKTEIYLSLAKEFLKQGKGVLVLIPEIALTDQMSNRFYSFFQDTISLLNSSLSDSRRYEEYRRIVSGESKIVLGTRSAIFAPVQNLGLIIIDEEHSDTYKQDSVPYYDAITVARMRKEIEGAKVLLGSATPRIIDNARAEKGVFQSVPLSIRYAASQEKDLLLVDMSLPNAFDPQKSSLISKTLFEELEKTLARKEQAMVLINRRGYAPMFLCRDCHAVAVCPNCGIPLNYHKKYNELRCHHCGYRIMASEHVCPCGGKDFLSLGYGTERAYEDLVTFFPKAKILRLDSDVSGNERRHEILESFALGESDILVGTQVIAKGHDFPNVTLAAMLDADSSLRLPSYTANEETFDLICQFVGRSGRGNKKGRILIQTYCPGNPVIQLAARQDYESFYALEMKERRTYQYPPFVYLCLVTVKAMDYQRCLDASLDIKNLFLGRVGNRRINIYGPSTPYIPYINGRYYRNILLKYKVQEEARELLSALKVFRMANKDVEVLIDVDPGTEGI